MPAGVGGSEFPIPSPPKDTPGTPGRKGAKRQASPGTGLRTCARRCTQRRPRPALAPEPPGLFPGATRCRPASRRRANEFLEFGIEGCGRTSCPGLARSGVGLSSVKALPLIVKKSSLAISLGCPASALRLCSAVVDLRQRAAHMDRMFVPALILHGDPGQITVRRIFPRPMARSGSLAFPGIFHGRLVSLYREGANCGTRGQDRKTPEIRGADFAPSE